MRICSSIYIIILLEDSSQEKMMKMIIDFFIIIIYSIIEYLNVPISFTPFVCAHILISHTKRHKELFVFR